MSRYTESSYTPETALRNIGAGFWKRYESDLLAFAMDRSMTDIPARIHDEWDSAGRSASGTDIRIEWALALYDHGDWPGLEVNKAAETSNPGLGDAAIGSVERRCSTCFHAKNPDTCSHGVLGPCEDWKQATEPEDHWPTWDDMKRAQYVDLRKRYNDR